MSVLDSASLEQSPLADLHAIASELGLDGYRRLRKADLIAKIVAHQGGEPAPADAEEPTEAEEPADEAEPIRAEVAPRDDETGRDEETQADEADGPAGRRRRGRRGGRGRTAGTRGDTAGEDDADAVRAVEAEPDDERAAAPDEEPVVEGLVELLPNGSGFMRVSPPDPSDDDVYISAAQVKRCELVSGDRIAGPRRAPRRSERFPSLVRIDTINGRPAAEIAQGARFEDLPAAFPAERLQLGSEDATVKAIEWLTPFGKGSRVTIVGPPRAGKTEALLRLAAALAGHDDLQLSLAIAGARPEEVGEWQRTLQPSAVAGLAASADAQANAVEQVVDRAQRLVVRGADAVVLIDTLSGLHPAAARKVLAAARNVVDGGSLTLIATASEPIGGETTVIALDQRLASTGRFPALDLAASGTIRPELLVGEAGAEAIARARAEAIDA
jgi:transcription termination factor Rho